MTPRAERVLANFFFSFGQEACRNVRARVRHYEPWRRDALGNEHSIGGFEMSQEIAGQLNPPTATTSAAAVLVSRYPSAGIRALTAAGVSASNIDRISRAVRGLRRATRGLNGMGGIYDQMTTLAAFGFSDGQLVGRHKIKLEDRSRREGFEELAQYADRVEPFFETIRDFITLTAMSLEAMPPPEINIFAIEAAFNTHDIPIPEDLHQIFYEPVSIEPSDVFDTPAPPAAPVVEGPGFLDELNDTFWDGISGINDGQSPFR